MNTTIRNEEPRDHRIVEDITRKAFWNLHVPGCNEHYLIHVMRTHEDFIPELDFVLEYDGKVVGNIMYTKAKLLSGNGGEKNILTFGPVSILPEYQRKGFGSKLIRHSFNAAVKMGHEAVVIFGNPGNYVGTGFQCCTKFNVSLGKGICPTALLVKELKAGALKGGPWTYQESPVYHVDNAMAEKFDAGFEAMTRETRPSQEEFYILSHSRIIIDEG